MSAATSAVRNLSRTSYLTLYMRRVPSIVVWGTGITAFLVWPHAMAGASNQVSDAPKINRHLW
jgi:hypothetical protein